MAGQQLPVKRIHCSADRCGLNQDIVAVGIFFKHPFDAANLSFDSAQTVHQLLSLILGTGCGLAVTAASVFFLCNIFFRFFTFFCTHLTYFVICFYRFILSCRILFFQSITSFSFYIPLVGIFTIYPLWVILSRYLLYSISHFLILFFSILKQLQTFTWYPRNKKKSNGTLLIQVSVAPVFFSFAFLLHSICAAPQVSPAPNPERMIFCLLQHSLFVHLIERSGYWLRKCCRTAPYSSGTFLPALQAALPRTE